MIPKPSASSPAAPDFVIQRSGSQSSLSSISLPEMSPAGSHSSLHDDLTGIANVDNGVPPEISSPLSSLHPHWKPKELPGSSPRSRADGVQLRPQTASPDTQNVIEQAIEIAEKIPPANKGCTVILHNDKLRANSPDKRTQNLMNDHQLQDQRNIAAGRKLSRALSKEGSRPPDSAGPLTVKNMEAALNSIGERRVNGGIPASVLEKVAAEVDGDVQAMAAEGEGGKKAVEAAWKSVRVDFLRNPYFVNGEQISPKPRADFPSDEAWQAHRDECWETFREAISALTEVEQQLVLAAAHQGTLAAYSSQELQLGRLVHPRGAQMSSQGLPAKEDLGFSITTGSEFSVTVNYTRYISSITTFYDNPDHELYSAPTCAGSQLKCHITLTRCPEQDRIQATGSHSLDMRFPTQAAQSLDDLLVAGGQHGDPKEHILHAVQAYADYLRQAAPDSAGQPDVHTQAISDLTSFRGRPQLQVAEELVTTLSHLQAILPDAQAYEQNLRAVDLDEHSVRRAKDALSLVSPYDTANQLYKAAFALLPGVPTAASVPDLVAVPPAEASPVIRENMQQVGLPITREEMGVWKGEINRLTLSLGARLGPDASTEDAEELLSQITDLSSVADVPRHLLTGDNLQKLLKVAQQAYQGGITSLLPPDLVRFSLDAARDALLLNAGDAALPGQAREIVLALEPEAFPLDSQWQEARNSYCQLLSSLLYQPMGNKHKLNTFSKTERKRILQLAASVGNKDWQALRELLPDLGTFRDVPGKPCESTLPNLGAVKRKKHTENYLRAALQCGNEVLTRLKTRTQPAARQDNTATVSVQGKLLGGTAALAGQPDPLGCAVQAAADKIRRNSEPDDEGRGATRVENNQAVSPDDVEALQWLVENISDPSCGKDPRFALAPVLISQLPEFYDNAITLGIVDKEGTLLFPAQHANARENSHLRGKLNNSRQIILEHISTDKKQPDNRNHYNLLLPKKDYKPHINFYEKNGIIQAGERKVKSIVKDGFSFTNAVAEGLSDYLQKNISGEEMRGKVNKVNIQWYVNQHDAQQSEINSADAEAVEFIKHVVDTVADVKEWNGLVPLEKIIRIENNLYHLYEQHEVADKYPQLLAPLREQRFIQHALNEFNMIKSGSQEIEERKRAENIITLLNNIKSGRQIATLTARVETLRPYAQQEQEIAERKDLHRQLHYVHTPSSYREERSSSKKSLPDEITKYTDMKNAESERFRLEKVDRKIQQLHKAQRDNFNYKDQYHANRKATNQLTSQNNRARYLTGMHNSIEKRMAIRGLEEALSQLRNSTGGQLSLTSAQRGTPALTAALATPSILPEMTQEDKKLLMEAATCNKGPDGNTESVTVNAKLKDGRPAQVHYPLNQNMVIETSNTRPIPPVEVAPRTHAVQPPVLVAVGQQKNGNSAYPFAAYIGSNGKPCITTVEKRLTVETVSAGNHNMEVKFNINATSEKPETSIQYLVPPSAPVKAVEPLKKVDSTAHKPAPAYKYAEAQPAAKRPEAKSDHGKNNAYLDHLTRAKAIAKEKEGLKVWNETVEKYSGRIKSKQSQSQSSQGLPPRHQSVVTG